MALFKILKGDSSRIDLNITPFHDGYAYFTPDDGGFYIDSEDNGVQRRIRINPPGAAGRKVDATLLASGWSAGEQTLILSEVTANCNGVIGMSQDISDAAVEAVVNGVLYACGQSDGSLTIAAFGDTPTCDIPVTLIVFG